MQQYDVIVIGGGPSGCSAAISLAKAGKKILLLDRAKFPRDKTCGDGISGRSVGALRGLGVLDSFSGVERTDSYGVTFSSPNGTVVPVSSGREGKSPPGFVCRREVFDNVLFQHAKSLCTAMEGFIATDFLMEGSRIAGVKGTLGDKELEFRAKVVVCADGAAGFTARKLGIQNTDDAHQFSGIRCYYEGVEGMTDQIELHFIDGVIPGYFWIFPLPDKRANVGLGILVKDLKKKKANLRALLTDTAEKHPAFRERFRNAKRSTEPKSWLLPLASKKVKMAGDGYVVVGDAASLIDPFTGEGIGNALTSGRCAADVIIKAFEKNDFSEAVLSEYPKLLWATIGNEVDTSYRMQGLAGSPFLLNLLIGKAKRSAEIRGAISDALLNPHNHRKIIDPLFILRALLA